MLQYRAVGGMDLDQTDNHFFETIFTVGEMRETCQCVLEVLEETVDQTNKM